MTYEDKQADPVEIKPAMHEEQVPVITEEPLMPVETTAQAKTVSEEDQGFIIAPAQEALKDETLVKDPDPIVAVKNPSSDLGYLPKPEYDPSKAHNVKLDPRFPITTDKATPATEAMSFPPAPMERASTVFEKMPNIGDIKSKKDIDWATTFSEGSSLHVASGTFDESLRREGSEWVQGISTNGELLKATLPKFPKQQNSVLTGQQAVQHALSYLGLGDMTAAPMWSSGFWVVFKPAPDTVWMELNRLLASESIRIGRETYGLAGSHMTSLTVETIISFILPYVYATSVNQEQMPIADIPKHLSAHDIQSFIWGFVSANYSHGFRIHRSCIIDPAKCREVTEETIEVREMQLLDHKALSEFHVNHMRTRRPSAMTLESVTEYQKRLGTNADHVIKLETGSQKTINVRFKVPSADNQFLSANKYVSTISTAVLKMVTSDTAVRERDNLFATYMTATEMCLYEHWVSEIEFDTNLVSSEDDIQSLLMILTKDATLRNSFFEAAKKYVERSVTSILGIPSFVCPKCNGLHSYREQTNEEFTDFIPVDIVQLFSYLAEFKTRLVQARMG